MTPTRPDPVRGGRVSCHTNPASRRDDRRSAQGSAANWSASINFRAGRTTVAMTWPPDMPAAPPASLCRTQPENIDIAVRPGLASGMAAAQEQSEAKLFEPSRQARQQPGQINDQRRLHHAARG